MDDLGYGDINSFGAINYETPNLNNLVNEGMLFTNFYTVQPVCSASRAALLTGCYSNRIGISGALMPYSKIGLNEKEITIAELLKEKGYATSIFGKWHLGHQKQFLPLNHGFDIFYGIPYSNDMRPEGRWDYAREAFPPLPFLDNMDTLSLNSFHKVRRIQALKHNLNNTFFTDFLMYREDQKQLEKTFNEDFGGDFKLYFDSLKEKYTTL